MQGNPYGLAVDQATNTLYASNIQQATGLDAGQVTGWKSWHRWTAICLLAYIYLAVAVAVQRQHDTGHDVAACAVGAAFPGTLASRRLPSTGRRNPYQPLW